MDYTRLTAARNAFADNPGPCELFKFLSAETWKRLEFSYLKRERAPFETTLTQNLVFSIESFVDQYPELSISLLESEDEEANGNDLELVVQFPSEGKAFYAPIQAKKIDRRGRYSSMDHGPQLELLLDYAGRTGGLPLYLLYNCVEPDRIPTLSLEPTMYGCTLVSAAFLFDNFYRKQMRKKNGIAQLGWRIPSFSDLHDQYAVPWHQLFCGIRTYSDFATSHVFQALSDWSLLNPYLGLIEEAAVPRFRAKHPATVKGTDTPMHQDSMQNPDLFAKFPLEERANNPPIRRFEPRFRIVVDVKS